MGRQLRIRDEDFYMGILVSLQVLHQYDSHTQAMDIVEAAGGIEAIAGYANISGTDVDMDTIVWLRTGKRQ
jgi:hypothetical protein